MKIPEFGKVRVSVVNGEPMFCLSDICKILNLQPGATKNRLDEKGVSLINTPTNGGMQNIVYVNEKNLYKAIMRSDKPEAEAFQDWVCGDVLPSIRKHGAYMTPEAIEKTLTSPDFIIQLATQLKNEQEKRKQAEAKIEADKPKVLFSEAVEASKKSILIRELAKIITQNGYQIGEKQLYERLRKAGYLCSVGESRNQPTQTYMNMGLFEIRKRVIIDGGETKVYNTTMVTGRGQQYFINKFLGKK
ncbi:anti-repressor Ant [Bacteroides phage B40-8]|uniref:anti-repressor Ant n=1 Tax=Bacteroides phage B40-8 TaxID=99179 RepID=UPI00017FB65C|nr:anti-repressor Ant [Bacteroides phage B40-8]ACH81958.1 putative antirepressor [Bacteroides phage B40-8]